MKTRINRTAPIHIYPTTLHGQPVTIKVYTPAKLGAPRKPFLLKKPSPQPTK